MASADPTDVLHPLSVEDYHRMIEVGILTEEDRIELLEGVLIEMSPEGPAHAAVVARLTRHLVRGLLRDDLTVRVQSPITLPPASEPEPDLAVVDTAASTFAAHPGGAYLVIEVSKSSLRIDRVRKQRLYATAGLPEYWIVDIEHRVVEVYRAPRAGTYDELSRAGPGDMLAPLSVDVPELDVSSLFDDA